MKARWTNKCHLKKLVGNAMNYTEERIHAREDGGAYIYRKYWKKLDTAAINLFEEGSKSEIRPRKVGDFLRLCFITTRLATPK